MSVVRDSSKKQYFVSKNEMSEAMARVNILNFEQMNDKIADSYNWSKEEVSLMSDYYKKWLALHICYKNVSIAPNERLDQYWHMHILDTRKYMKDCDIVFGKYFHHYPYFGLEGDKQALSDGFDLTNVLFENHFSHTLVGKGNPCSSTGCR